jgi:hypothetical protein
VRQTRYFDKKTDFLYLTHPTQSVIPKAECVVAVSKRVFEKFSRYKLTPLANLSPIRREALKSPFPCREGG